MPPPFQGRDFYFHAGDVYGRLAAIQPNEAEIRSIISRAYYAAFLEARDYAAIQGSNVTIHKDVREHYKPRGKEGHRIHQRLADLLNKRKTADYDTGVTVLRRDAQKALKLSEQILQDLATLFNTTFP